MIITMNQLSDPAKRCNCHPSSRWPCVNCRLRDGESISFQTAPDYTGRYEFIDYNVTGKPVQIHGKRHWRTFLRDNDCTDDVSFSEKSLSSPAEQPLSQSFRSKIREGLVAGVKKVQSKSYSTIGKRLSATEVKRQLKEAKCQESSRP